MALIPRFFVLHVLFLPGLIIGLITLHLVLLVLHKHTQYRGGPAREDNVVGRHFWPVQVFLSTGLFFLTAALVALIGGLFQVNPIWAYGPFNAAVVASPAQPDWYLGWLDGSLRIFPPFEPTIFGVTIPSPFIPGVVIPTILFTVVALWPFLEQRFTHDDREHHGRRHSRAVRRPDPLRRQRRPGVLPVDRSRDADPRVPHPRPRHAGRRLGRHVAPLPREARPRRPAGLARS